MDNARPSAPATTSSSASARCDTLSAPCRYLLLLPFFFFCSGQRCIAPWAPDRSSLGQQQRAINSKSERLLCKYEERRKSSSKQTKGYGAILYPCGGRTMQLPDLWFHSPLLVTIFAFCCCCFTTSIGHRFATWPPRPRIGAMVRWC